MSSNCLVLQLTCALVAAAAVTAVTPQRGVKGRETKELSDTPGIDPATFYDPQDDCLFDPIPSDITFFYYTKKYPAGKILDFFSPPLTDLHKSTLTKIVTHGMKSSLSTPEIKNLINAYLNRSDPLNVIALDWSSYTHDMYREAAKSTVKIGKIASSIFCLLYKYFDIYPYQMHFIGHGLGAHLLGITARESRTSVGRITGLDPARLCFEEYCHGLHYPQLNKNDAIFVDVIHSDAGRMGVANTHGTADFYANNGRNQPTCHNVIFDIINPACDSLTSVTYFTETIENPFLYFAIDCESPYPTLNCNKKTDLILGEYVEATTRGIYNFITSNTTHPLV